MDLGRSNKLETYPQWENDNKLKETLTGLSWLRVVFNCGIL
jgi:hypothetical protein